MRLVESHHLRISHDFPPLLFLPLYPILLLLFCCQNQTKSGDEDRSRASVTSFLFLFFLITHPIFFLALAPQASSAHLAPFHLCLLFCIL